MNEQEEYAASGRVQWNEYGYEYSDDKGATWKPFSQSDVSISLPSYGQGRAIEDLNAGAVIESWYRGQRIQIRAKTAN